FWLCKIKLQLRLGCYTMAAVCDFIDLVEQSIEERGLFSHGQRILVAVSGGLDSMILLYCLNRLSKAHGWKLTVAHFNHQLRGANSDADERLVQRTAKRLGWKVIAGRADVKKFARDAKISLEMAARKLRHGFLARAARESKAGS